MRNRPSYFIFTEPRPGVVAENRSKKMNNTVDSLFHALVALGTSPRSASLLALLLVAAAVDLRTYKIPNWLTGAGLLLGLVCSTVLATPPYSGLLGGLGGIVTAMLVLLPLYAIRVLGAGDVKLMCAIGAFLGALGTLQAILFTFIAGGIVAVVFALSRGELQRMVANVKNTVQFMVFAVMGGVQPTAAIEPGASIGKLPYGVSIAAGTAAYLLAAQWGHV
jgi:prepilin peptidase CpaA